MRVLAAAAVLVLAAAARAFAGGGPAETVVLVNGNSADSRRVAEHYAKARQIPASQVVEVRCTPELTAPLADFVRDVADPLREALRARGLEDRVRFVVLTQGMPIQAKTARGDVSTTAALALLHSPVCGAPQPGVQPPLRSPAYRGGLPIPPNVDCDRFLHVTALLSTTADEAIALIDRSVASDGTAPKGALFVFQDANGNANTRNEAYDPARRELEALGAATERVKAGKDEATGRKRVMGYMSGGSYSGVTAEGVASNEYLPGALCDHLQSFGAVPANFGTDARRHSQFPVTHMVRAGVTGVHGAVSEPFTVAFPDPDLFTAYLEGATLAETFSARLPIAYWMNLVLGDPLCAPYAKRPPLTVEGAPSGPWKGTCELRVQAPGAKRVDVYVDGTWASGCDGAGGSADPADGAHVVDTWRFPDGPHRILVQATGADAWEGTSWTTLDATFANPELRVLVAPARFAHELRAELSRAPSADEHPTLTLTAGGAPVPGTSRAEGRSLVFVPDGPVASAECWAAASGTRDERGWRTVPSPDAFECTQPESVAAGEAMTLQVRVRRGANALAGWKGRVEVRQADPPVRLFSRDVAADAEGRIAVPVRFTRAGAVSLRVSLPDDGHEATATTAVRAGPPHHATTPLDRVALGQPADVDVVLEDAFGNRIEDFAGEMRLSVPTDAFAALPGPLRMTAADRGRVVFRDVVLTRAGRHALVMTDGAGRVWSQPTEGVAAVHAPVRSWLVAQAAAKDDASRLASSDPGRTADRDGSVSGGRLFRRLRARSDEVVLPADPSAGDVPVAAVTFVEALTTTKARLLGAAPGRLVVLLDGKPVHDGTPAGADPRGKREPLADVTFAEGRHRLTVIAPSGERGPAFSLEIDDGAGKHADALLVRATAGGDAPETWTASGRVRRGRRGVAGAKVVVRAGGAERAATTAADGVWFVEGLPSGEIEARAEGPAGLSPDVRRATLDGGNATDLDFVVADTTPPTVRLDGAPPRFGRTVVLFPAVEDDDEVRSVRLLAGDREVAHADGPPWRLAYDTSGTHRGKVQLVAVARDASGNEARSAAVTVTLVDDAKGPVVRLSGVSNDSVLKKKATVSAAVTDDLPVASVRFRLDGKDLGDARTAPPWTAEVDPAGLAAGTHTLEATAADLDGNETTATLRFRIR